MVEPCPEHLVHLVLRAPADPQQLRLDARALEVAGRHDGRPLGQLKQQNEITEYLAANLPTRRASKLVPGVAGRSGVGAAAAGQQKSPALSPARGSVAEYGVAVTYFRVRDCTLSSAQTRFTVLFGWEGVVPAATAADGRWKEVTDWKEFKPGHEIAHLVLSPIYYARRITDVPPPA